ncbi:ATP-dependent Lon protease [Sporosarcina sp. BI001-red]|uniref:ATP-dependent Lon protease n=1 Tax=Sporosarcina sp. BI001-red TaxID=2282866 RepID=UPI000E2464E9|nr:ATP-dependent Lon protease [Sporosarcina sp. BI001-red]REB11610.1 ATP-dependent Lon protease [Sporosarcina sp. BI001-red]
MNLFLCMLTAGVLGILVLTGPIGTFVAAILLVGILFRTCLLVKDIHTQTVPKKSKEKVQDKVQDAYERYIKERDAKEMER